MKRLLNPPNQSSHAAELGTAAHALLEHTLGKGTTSNLYIGEIFGGFEVDSNMADAVNVACSYVRDRLCDLFPHQYPEPKPEITALAIQAGVLSLERKGYALAGRNDVGGTADIVIDAWPEILEVIDYKHGAGIRIDVEGCWQTRCYLLGAAPRNLHEYDAYAHTICQPRHYAAMPSGVSSEMLTPLVLEAFRDELRQACTRVDQATAHPLSTDELLAQGHLVAGDHCHPFCPHRNICPSIKAKVQEIMMIDFADPPQEQSEAPQERYAEILHWTSFISQYLKVVGDAALAYAVDGGKIPGYTLEEGRGSRKWSGSYDEDAIVAALVSEYGLSQDVIKTEPTLKSGPQIEKLIAKKQRSKFNEHLLYRPTGAVKLVPGESEDPGDDFADTAVD